MSFVEKLRIAKAAHDKELRLDRDAWRHGTAPKIAEGAINTFCEKALAAARSGKSSYQYDACFEACGPAERLGITDWYEIILNEFVQLVETKGISTESYSSEGFRRIRMSISW